MPRPITTQDDRARMLARVRSAYSEGLTFEDMARRFHKSRRWISAQCKGLPRPDHAPPKRATPSLGRFT